MPGVNVTVSLSEVLEVRGAPLTETEIWTLLCLGAEALQDIFITEQATNEFGPVFVINPDTMSLTGGGQVAFGQIQRVQQYANYMAPETDEGFVMTATSIEQIYVYALGKSLVYSAEFGLRPEEPNSSRHHSGKRSKPLNISHGLESILGSMTSRNPAERIALVKVLEACSVHAARQQRGKLSLSHIALDLYRTVLGIEGQEETIQDGGNTSDKIRPKTTSQEKDPERSKRKKRRSKHSDRQKNRSPAQRYRSRSRSRSRSYSRSRSRSPAKQNGKGRGKRRAESPDSGYHRHTPFYDENYGPNSRPDHHSAVHSTGRSYHLSDITFSASQNGQDSKRKSSNRRPDSRHSRGVNRAQSNPNTKGSLKDNDIKENPAFKKYLKLKERQRKLRALRGGIMESTESDELSDIVMDHMSETRSVMSLVSHSQGAYRPDIHKQYGSNSALRMGGQESDLESIVSSDVSMFGHDHNALRANGDISDPYIQQLQQMTAAPPPPVVFASKPPVTKPKQKQQSPRQVPQKQQEFYGPEFVHRSTKPINRIALPLQGESRKSPGRACRVVVVLLNGQKLEVMCDPSTTGQQLFEAVVTQIELPEFYFFGLTYVTDDEHFFIPAETKLHKVAPDGWKESWKVQSAPTTFTVYLRVKFYVENSALLKHETTKHQLYLQLRRDLLEERCHCDETKALALAGLALQAEYGDYSLETMGRNYFVPEHYFPGRAVKRLGSAYIRDSTPEAHMDAKGLTETEAEIEFIKLVQEQLPEYGIHFHKLLKKKGDTSNTIWVGLDTNEMTLAETSGGQRIIVQHHPWGAIQKISFNRRRFSVQPRPEIGQAKPVKMNFFTTTYRKGQYLLKFCTAQHSFQLKMRSRLALNGEVGFDAAVPDHESIGNTEDMESVNESDEGTITDEHISPREADVELEAAGLDSHEDIPQKQPVAYRNPPPYRPNSSISLVDLPGPKLRTARPVVKSASREDGELRSLEEKIIPSQATDTNQAYVIDMSTRSMDQTLFPTSGNETISNTLHQRFKDELLSPEPPTAEREIFDVVLLKEPEFGIGITIVGGDSNRTHDLGIFVKSVTVNGPAHRDGRIKPGDRLLAINDGSVEGLPHHEAVKMIKYSGSQVKLKISQIQPPGSLRKKDHDEMNFHMKLRGSCNGDIERDNISLDKETSSSLYAADSSTIPVITVQSDDKKLEKDNKNDGQMSSIPDGINVCEDHGRSSVDVHSTLSQVDSLNSELAIPDLPLDEQIDIVEIPEESDTDSEFDERMESVINEVPIINENIRQETAAKILASNRQRSESSESTTETFEVYLEKKNGGFGLNVTGGVNTSVRYGGIYVKSVVPGGAADDDATIKKGDRIVMVDNNPLEGFTHKQAVEALCKAPAVCKLIIERGLIPTSRHSSTASRHSKRSNKKSREKQSVQAIPPAVQRLRDESPLRAVSESPTEHVKVLELSLTSTAADVTETPGAESEVKVDEMQIEPGLSENKKKLMIAVKLLYEKFVTKGNCYSVDLKKGSQGLGFSIIGGEPSVEDDTIQYVSRVKRVFPIGPAADSKRILAGDVILLVNGKDMRRLNHSETLMSLRTAGKTVTLIMCRPDPEKLPPLPQLESQESLEITPASSTSNLADTDSSDSDSGDDGGVTPAREILITPPTGFSPQKYPVDANGSIVPKVVSPPPPLPQSPPPALIRSGSVTPPSAVVEVGVAELMDSCRLEMVQINQTTEANKPDDRDTTPIVRELSTLGFEKDSREATPSADSKGITPVNVVEYSTMGSEDFSNDNLNLDSMSSMSETSSSKESVLKSPNRDHKSVAHSLLQRSPACDKSDTESESSFYIDTGKSTSLVDTKLDTYSQQESLQSLNETDKLDTYSQQESLQSLNETDNQEVSQTETYTIETVTKSLDDLNVGADGKNVDVCDGDDVYINETDEITEADDVNIDDLDDNLRLLEQKYSEIDEQDENGDETESEESSSSDEEQSSVRETFSQVLEESLHTGEIEVTLTKPEGKGLGFTVAGGANTTGGCYIKAVLQNPALSDGTLKAGDRLIKVNGIDMRSLNHFEAVTVLREAADQVTIRVYREPKEVPELQDNYIPVIDGQALSQEGPYGQIKDEDVLDETIETEPLDGQDSESDSDESSQDGQPDREPVSEDSERETVQKEDYEREPVQKEDYEREPVQKEDYEREPVQEEDCVDEEEVTEDTSLVQDLEETLEKSETELPLSASSRGSNGKNQFGDGSSHKEAFSSQKSPHSPEGSVCHIDLEKQPSGELGISLVTAETENQTGVYVRTISAGGVAHIDGRLSVGDKILQINGKSLIGLTHTKAATLLRNSERRVTLTVSRNRGKKPVRLEKDMESGEEEANAQDETENKTSDTDNNTRGSESDCEHSDGGDESSLSLTKHLPADIHDDNVEDLVKEAERTLDDAEQELRSESGDREVSSGKAVMREDKSHLYLRAAETIEYHHAELDEDADERTDMLEDDFSKVSSDHQDGQEDEIVTDSELREHEDNEDDFDDRQNHLHNLHALRGKGDNAHALSGKGDNEEENDNDVTEDYDDEFDNDDHNGNANDDIREEYEKTNDDYEDEYDDGDDDFNVNDHKREEYEKTTDDYKDEFDDGDDNASEKADMGEENERANDGYENEFDDDDDNVSEKADMGEENERGNGENNDNEEQHESDEEETEEEMSVRCWCDGLRKLDMVVPDEVTPDWLYGLSVATIPEDVKGSIPGLISELQEKLELDEPQDEFRVLRTMKPTDACSDAVLPHNRDKNRFRNVLPYDLNRVKLSEDNETDYINASHVQIDVADIICDYIACQGPLPHTSDDFWEMVWQREVTVIVMLTLDMEAKKVKCHRYWPDSVDTPLEVCDGKYRLSLLYQNVLDDFDIRNILMENLESGESRSLYHLNYTTWPDHGVPQSAVPLLQCMRLSHQLRTTGPLVVHCSAGIGRTGTFITVDVALAHVEKALKCEIEDIVSELRRQRQGMIQTRDQYLFCYTAIIEALLNHAS